MAEYDLEQKLVEEHLWERRAEFLAINPAATLPVLVDAQTVIIGVGPIAEYLDETEGALKRERRLYSEDPIQRAEMRRLVDWALVKFENEVTRYIVNERVTKRIIPADAGNRSPDSQALRAARTNIKYHLDYLGWLAATRNWMAGDRMSFADIALASAISALDYLGEVPWEERQELREWYARIKSRPAFRTLLQDRVRGVPPVAHYVDLDF
ncbi:glutathione S-transferase family protein [Ahrensia sp. R2A130]|nr:glutathione S-transferase family protein [Ahrensia sp. R2A130]